MVTLKNTDLICPLMDTQRLRRDGQVLFQEKDKNSLIAQRSSKNLLIYINKE